MITQKQLKELFSYNKLTGKLTRLTRPCNSVKIGDEAGFYSQCTDNLTYRRVEIDGFTHHVHRLVFLYVNGHLPVGHVDHIDGDGLNNKWVNLREVSASENQRNRKTGVNNKTGIIGVSQYKRDSTWRVAISISGKKKHIGYFEDFFEACCIRKSAEITHNYHSNHGTR